MNISNIIASVLVSGFCLLLSACSLFSPVNTHDENAYFIDSIPDHVPSAKKRNIALLILAPSALPAFNTTQMAYTTKPYQLSYFAMNRWAETPAQMLQPLIVDTMVRTHYFSSVIGSPYSGNVDYVLGMQILTLQQNFSVNPPQLELRIRAELASIRTNRIIATKEFYIEEPMSQANPYGGVVAANEAVEDFLQQLAYFSIKSMR